MTHDSSKSVVTIHGKTLTPRAYHANDDGTYHAKIAKLPSISIDPFFSEIKKAEVKKDKPAKGKFDTNDYVERGIRNQRMTSDMLSLDAKRPEKFFFSKTGRLAEFHQDVMTFLGNYLQIDWQSMPANYRKFFNDKMIGKQYEKIAEILRSYAFYLVLKEPLSTTMIDQLTQHLQKLWGIELKIANELQPFSPTHQAINLLIHHDKDYYKENNLPDPYPQIQSFINNHSILKQSLTLETLITDKKTLNLPAIDNAMTEILVKIEVMLGKLVLIKPEQNWRCITAHYIKNLDPDSMDEFDGYDVLDYQANNNSLHYQRIALDNTLADDIDLQLNATVQSSNYKMKATDYFIIQNPTTDPNCYLIQESNYRPLPDFIGLHQQMKAIDNAHTHGFHRDWAKQYLTRIENNEIQLDMDKKADKDFFEKLTNIANAADEIISKEKFFKFDLRYKGKAKDFIDWVYQTHGYLWNTSLRGQETGYVEALKGFYYEPSQQYYFVGLADGLDSKISNFSVMRKILSNRPNSQALALLNLMDETFYIRHKQSTVLPFLFKHLREMREKFDTNQQRN